MAAFSTNDGHALRANIRTMYGRVDAISQLSLTHEDFLALFVPAEDRDMFRRAALVSKRPDYGKVSYPWQDGTRLIFELYGLSDAPMPLIPREVRAQPGADSVLEKISEWLENGVHASRDFGRVMKVFDKMNDLTSLSVMRFYWPSIQAIAGESEVTAHLVERMKTMSTVARTALPHGLQPAVRKTMQTVTTALLLSKDDPAVKPAQQVQVRVARGEQYSEPGIGAFIGLQ